MSRYEAADVRRYYDRHTSSFVAFGQGRGTGAIHRAVWAPGVTDRAAAFHYVDDQIAAAARDLTAGPDLHVVDLGCGVGASLLYLARRLPMHGTGVTLSSVQVEIANSRIADAGLASRLRCVEADYSNLPSDVSTADLAYAIESFVHAPSPEAFFSECARLVRRGGLLMICDDVRGNDADARAERSIDEFCAGWHVNALLRPEEVQALASAAGFACESTRDLTPFLELRRWRDLGISLWLSGLSLLGIDRSRFDDLVGGRALQTCLRHGWVRYQLLVFRRR
jgi:cyclopropane fatty-acyl-phospholipid synthase-like methyltransferase